MTETLTGTPNAGNTLPDLDWSSWSRVLVVVAHPDDPEYGLSAAVKTWTDAGVEVAYLLLTTGEAGIEGMDPDTAGPLRAGEQRAACDIVGAEELVLLNHPDGMLTYGLELRRDIARMIRRCRPDAVVVTNYEVEAYGWVNHADHRVAGLAAVDAFRDAANPWVFRELREQEGLEAWSARDLLIAGHPEPTHRVAVGAAAVQAGVESLRAHVEYLRALPDHPVPEEFIPETLADGEGFSVPFRTFGT